jgi:hypothetical protein
MPDIRFRQPLPVMLVHVALCKSCPAAASYLAPSRAVRSVALAILCVCRWEVPVYEGAAAHTKGGGSTGLAALNLEGHKHPAVAVAAGNTIKVRVYSGVNGPLCLSLGASYL